MTSAEACLFDRRAWLGASLGAGAALLASSTSHAGSNPAASPGAPTAPRINVSLNESAYGPSPRVIQSLRLELRGLERYTGDEARALARQIAELEAVAEEQVLLGEVLEPLGLQLGLTGGAGGEFLYSEPGYTALVDAARPVGGVALPIALNDRQENDLPAFAAKLSRRTRAVFLVNPHNPSGTVSDASELKAAVREFAKKALVVVDEAYLDYLDDWPARTLVELVRAGENVIVFRTFSKLHGLAALPLGYAIAPRKLAGDLRKSGLGSPRSLNRLALRAAAVSLRESALSQPGKNTGEARTNALSRRAGGAEAPVQRGTSELRILREPALAAGARRCTRRRRDRHRSSLPAALQLDPASRSVYPRRIAACKRRCGRFWPECPRSRRFAPELWSAAVPHSRRCDGSDDLLVR